MMMGYILYLSSSELQSSILTILHVINIVSWTSGIIIK